MKKESPNLKFILTCVILLTILSCKNETAESTKIHPWEVVEITLRAENSCNNFYTDVTCWVELEGPGFKKQIYGFWDGENIFRVRLVATKPGKWTWKSYSNQPGDQGLNNKQGYFEAVAWKPEEIEENPNRRGFIRPSENGHALQYDDGTPFFLTGDTWLAGTTWRLPFRNAASTSGYEPGPGIGFEDAVLYRKRQGFNSVSMIACFPNWEADENANTYADENGIYLRNAWEKFGYFSVDSQLTSKDMRDENGNRPFEMSKEHKGVADFDRINPEYFRSLDKKMKFLSDQGFVPLLESVRRDNCPAWKAYFDFNESYARYIQYLISRYGAYNIIFSGIHLDWIPKEYSLTADEFNEALTYHLKKYGPLPFGQPHTTLINNSTYWQFGHGEKCPWLTMHSVGNNPRDHRVSDMLDTLFRLKPAYPAINFEPYYTGWDHSINKPHGERPPADSDRDNYFSRAMMYVSVLSGGLSGHVHGTSAYDITTTGEPAGFRPHFWDAMKYKSAGYMKHLKNFVLSEGARYQALEPAHADITPGKAPGSFEDGLDGWSYMMRTREKDFALLYFENGSLVPVLSGFIPETKYSLQWYDPSTGVWEKPVTVVTGREGSLRIDSFPDNQNPSVTDRALKIIRK
ncbi:MAG TPA: DUF4038 domain-containing protein [Bacteroidales bacterium]|nr:DUF4038 domain-containing protein [Bacteroidales bacterium]HRT88891.1 DUF4038 domain-containing protein [Bacteroidales bacterium]